VSSFGKSKSKQFVDQNTKLKAKFNQHRNEAVIIKDLSSLREDQEKMEVK